MGDLEDLRFESRSWQQFGSILNRAVKPLLNYLPVWLNSVHIGLSLARLAQLNLNLTGLAWTNAKLVKAQIEPLRNLRNFGQFINKLSGEDSITII